MSKRFKQQDYFRYPCLGLRWRKPRGRQSKLRIQKRGSGKLPRIGFGTPCEIKDYVPVGSARAPAKLIENMNDVKNTPKDSVILISSAIGSKKALIISEECKKMGFKIINMKKIKRAVKIKKKIEKPKKEVKTNA